MTPDRQDSQSIEDALAAIQDSWDKLIVAMSTASEADYTGTSDAAGWTPLDHLAHVTAWERSRRYWLLGRPRYAGLGVTADEFEQGIDQLNEIVRQQTAGHSYQQVIDDAHLGHQQMLDAILSYNATAQQDIGGITRAESDRVGALLIEHLADHYDEHRGYIETILAS